MSAPAITQAGLRQRVEEFLAREAELADSHRYDEWLELWSTDGIYWVPSNADDYDPARHVSIIYDDYARIEERCFRLSAEGAHSQDPPSRLCRVVGNVQIETAQSGDSGELAVRSKVVLVEVRSGVKNVYGMSYAHRLIDTGESFKIRSKKVVLLDNDEPLGNLTFIL